MPSLRELMLAKKAGAAKSAAPAPAKPAGLKISDPTAPEPGEVLAPPPKKRAEGRQLDQTQGEGIPMDYPCESASPEEKLWWQARHSLSSDLVIWIEPESDHAWLAVTPPDRKNAPLVLLHRLPLASNPRAGDPY